MANIGFIGAGGIARAHAFSLNALKYYYQDAPEINFVSVSSLNESSREDFAKKYLFDKAQSLTDFTQNKSVDTVFILGPNSVHYEHLNLASQMPGVSHIYLEKPVCSSLSEEKLIKSIMKKMGDKVVVSIGFQYLQTAAVREALSFWKSGTLGKPIHFDLKYYHGDYLQKEYRDKRKTRLTAAPDGGAMADLGSHGISLLTAFLGEDLRVLSALQSGNFKDVQEDSDLFSLITLTDPKTKAVGTLSASRISSGTGDLVSFELYAEKGTLKYNSHTPDFFEYYLEKTGQWVRQPVGSNYLPITSFPSGHVPGGWLRSMIHAHYIFLTGKDEKAAKADMNHGLAVQRIVRETATHLEVFREEA